MKNHTWRYLGFSLTILCCSCLHENASDTNKPVEAIAAIALPGGTNIVSPAMAATNGIEVLKTIDTNVVESIDMVAPVSLANSPGLEEVIKLCGSNLDESVILAHIRSSDIPYNPTADELIYLNDIGISSRIVTAMIQRGAVVREQSNLLAANSATNTTAAPMNDSQPAAVATMIPAQPAVVLPPSNTEPAVAPSDGTVSYDGEQAVGETQPVVVNQFYNELSPYGTWVNVPDYGWSWQPTVVVTQPQWRPYCDSGRWLYTECGWYWQSDYTWGWAPFHYGRWYRHAHHGWLWCPDTVWGPSWVCWRRSPIHCGWAPLPPHARYIAGHGFSYHGMMVGSDFGFSLGFDDFTFISYNHFTHRNPYRYYLHRKDAELAYRKTTVINDYHEGPGKIPGNFGIDRDHVAHISRTEIKKISIRDMPPAAGKIVKPDRVEREGSSLVLYKPPTGNPGAAMHGPLRGEPRKGPASVDSQPGGDRSPRMDIKPASLTAREINAGPDKKTGLSSQMQDNRPSGEQPIVRSMEAGVPITRIHSPSQSQKKVEERATSQPAIPSATPGVSSLSSSRPLTPSVTSAPAVNNASRLNGGIGAAAQQPGPSGAVPAIRSEARKPAVTTARPAQDAGISSTRPGWTTPPSASDLVRQSRTTTGPSPSGNIANPVSAPAVPAPRSTAVPDTVSRQENRSYRPVQTPQASPSASIRQPNYTPAQPSPRATTPVYTAPSLQRSAPSSPAPMTAPPRTVSAPASSPPPPSASRSVEVQRAPSASPSSKPDAGKDKK